jgi:hypothetical protein
MFRNHYLTLLFLAPFTLIYSQNVTINDLITLKNFDDKVKVEEFLAMKGWTFYSSSVQTDFNDRDIIIYAYNPVGPNNMATCFIHQYFENIAASSSIKIETTSLPKYNEYLNKIKSFGCTLLSSENTDGSIKKVYQGKSTTFEIKVLSQTFNESTVTVYSILISHNYDYEE